MIKLCATGDCMTTSLLPHPLGLGRYNTVPNSEPTSVLGHVKSYFRLAA